MAEPTAPGGGTRRRSLGARIAAILIGLLAVAGITVAAPAPAATAAAWNGNAWQHAYGRYVTYTNGETIWRGSEWVDGKQVYCLEPRWHSAEEGDSVSYGMWSAGTFAAEGDSNSVTVVSAGQAQAINWLVATHGQVPDDQNALNVASAIRTFLHAGNGNGDAPGTNLYRNALPYLQALQSYVPPAAPASVQTVAMELSAEPTNDYLGRLRIVSTPLTTIPATITLTNGVFAANGSTALTLPSVSAGLELAIRGVPPADDGVAYTVSASLVGNGVVATGAYPDSLLIATHDARHQEQVMPQPPAQYAVALAGSVADARPRVSGFFPVVATVAAADVVDAGEAFRDAVTIAVGTSGGLEHEWPRDPETGAYAAVAVDCTVFGPFEAAPAEQPEPPPGAPVATTFRVVTGDEGPDTVYEGVSETPLELPGHYSTVCRIDAAAQPESSAVAADYVYADAFGQAAETVRVPEPPMPELAATGAADPLPRVLGAAAALLLGAICLGFFRARRRAA